MWSKEYSSEFIANSFRHIRCSTCGMILVSPRLKESIAHDLYEESDYTEYFKIKLIPSVEYRRNVLAKNKFKQISEYFDKPGKVLDIGCGLGEVLSVFQDGGWNCTGIDFNSFAAEYAAKNFNLNIINKSIFDIDESSESSYDLIMLWGVLEHFYDPKKILKKVNKLLSPDGLLLLEVPSADSLLVRLIEATARPVDRIIEGDRHIMLFSVRSFEQITKACGFTPEKIVTNGLDIATINRLYIGDSLKQKDVTDLQSILDESFQGDLLRGFFRKSKV